MPPLLSEVLRDGHGESGLAIGRFVREFSGEAERWAFQASSDWTLGLCREALGSFCRGQTWKDSVRASESVLSIL